MKEPTISMSLSEYEKLKNEINELKHNINFLKTEGKESFIMEEYYDRFLGDRIIHFRSSDYDLIKKMKDFEVREKELRESRDKYLVSSTSLQMEINKLEKMSRYDFKIWQKSCIFFKNNG